MTQTESFYRTARWLSVGFLLSALLLGGLVTTQAQEKGEQQDPEAPKMPPKMMEKLQERAAQARSGEPAPSGPVAANEHEAMLHKLVGNWKADVRMYTGEGEPMTMRGTMRNELILGGRALKGDYKGEFMGESMLGFGLEGYDADGAHYSVWADSVNPGATVDHGTCEHGERDVVTYEGEFVDAETGETKQRRVVLTVRSHAQYTMEEWQWQGDEEPALAMQIIFSKL